MVRLKKKWNFWACGFFSSSLAIRTISCGCSGVSTSEARVPSSNVFLFCLRESVSSSGEKLRSASSLAMKLFNRQGFYACVQLVCMPFLIIFTYFILYFNSRLRGLWLLNLGFFCWKLGSTEHSMDSISIVTESSSDSVASMWCYSSTGTSKLAAFLIFRMTYYIWRTARASFKPWAREDFINRANPYCESL